MDVLWLVFALMFFCGSWGLIDALGKLRTED